MARRYSRSWRLLVYEKDQKNDWSFVIFFKLLITYFVLIFWSTGSKTKPSYPRTLSITKNAKASLWTLYGASKSLEIQIPAQAQFVSIKKLMEIGKWDS